MPTDTPPPPLTDTPISPAPTPVPPTDTPLPPTPMPSGGRIAFTSERDGNWEIYVMNADGSLLRTLEGHTDGVTSVVFSPDGVTLSSGSEDGTVRLWGVATD
jgi:WD40 repeat protein